VLTVGRLGERMLSVVIATKDSERALVPTLAALIPGVTAGLVREVIVCDAGSRDATAEVADAAGCQIVVSNGSAGVRLKAAAFRRAPAMLGSTLAEIFALLRARKIGPEQGLLIAKDFYDRLGGHPNTGDAEMDFLRRLGRRRLVLLASTVSRA
jgi:glycosyltransferase involved in cell wall biosynthesis